MPLDFFFHSFVRNSLLNHALLYCYTLYIENHKSFHCKKINPFLDLDTQQLRQSVRRAYIARKCSWCTKLTLSLSQNAQIYTFTKAQHNCFKKYHLSLKFATFLAILPDIHWMQLIHRIATVFLFCCIHAAVAVSDIHFLLFPFLYFAAASILLLLLLINMSELFPAATLLLLI